MLKRINSIKNVGRFRNSASPGVQQLPRHVLVFAANGFGKTTLCAILRSLQSGDATHVIGRRTLGTDNAPEIEVLGPSGPIRFKETGWSETMPDIAIFDGQFIAENVHSDTVEVGHKRNLYRVLIGRDGVGLAEEEARWAAESRAKTTEITAAAKALQTHMPAGIRLEDFLKFPADADIDAKIEEQKKTLAAVREASAIKARAALVELTLPVLPERLASVLALTIDDIADDAELRVSSHLAAHQMTETGEAWLSEGLPFVADEKCPFCGQGLEGVSLIAAYRSLFGASYRQLKAEIATMRATVEQAFGDAAIGRLTTQAATNVAGREFWKQYCTLDDIALEVPAELKDAISGLRQAMLTLLDRKAQTPLEAIAVATDSDFTTARALFDQVNVEIAGINTAIGAGNVVIAGKKAAAEAADLDTAQKALNRLLAIKKRHEADIAAACTAYGQMEADKNDFETKKTAARTQLDAHTKKVVKPYQIRINQILEDFNAGFTITETKHAYPGGIATSSYQIVINSTPIDLGDGKTGLDQPSFKNTLSAGDRTTLALAFFLTNLEKDPDRAKRIVVFDDPFNSQDAFRRLNTQFHIRKTGEACAQVFVLSHDAGFLNQVWGKCPTDQRIAIQLSDHGAQGSKIGPCNLEDACKGRVATEIDDLLQYLGTNAGKPHDIIKKMRVVLETFCRATFPGYFGGDDNLGEIVKKIRTGGDEHPAQALLDDLDRINDFSVEHHHGEDPADGTVTQIDGTELKGFVRKTLKLSNNLQA